MLSIIISYTTLYPRQGSSDSGLWTKSGLLSYTYIYIHTHAHIHIYMRGGEGGREEEKRRGEKEREMYFKELFTAIDCRGWQVQIY